MKRSALALLCMLAFSPALAADDAPPSPSTTPVALSATDINDIAAALNVASDQCRQVRAGCAVGWDKDAILEKLRAAMTELQHKAK